MTRAVDFARFNKKRSVFIKIISSRDEVVKITLLTYVRASLWRFSDFESRWCRNNDGTLAEFLILVLFPIPVRYLPLNHCGFIVKPWDNLKVQLINDKASKFSQLRQNKDETKRFSRDFFVFHYRPQDKSDYRLEFLAHPRCKNL